MSDKKRGQYCGVPMCISSSTRDPDKVFFSVLKKDMRDAWIKASNRDKPLSESTKVTFCQDHFDLERDCENYVRYKLQPGTRLRLKKDAIPSRFECQGIANGDGSQIYKQWNPHKSPCKKGPSRKHRMLYQLAFGHRTLEADDDAESLPEKIPRLSSPDDSDDVEQDLQTYLANKQSVHLGNQQQAAYLDNQEKASYLSDPEETSYLSDHENSAHLPIEEQATYQADQQIKAHPANLQQTAYNLNAEIKEELEPEKEDSLKDVLACKEEILSEEDDCIEIVGETPLQVDPVEKGIGEGAEGKPALPRIFEWMNINSANSCPLPPLHIKKHLEIKEEACKENRVEAVDLLPPLEGGEISIKEEPLPVYEHRLSAQRKPVPREMIGEACTENRVEAADQQLSPEGSEISVIEEPLSDEEQLPTESIPVQSVFLRTLEQHIEEPQLRCSVPSCSYTTLDQAKMTKHHLYSHNKGQAFKCPYCHLQTLERPYLSFHVESVHKIKVFTCQCCHFEGKNIDHLLTHFHSKHLENNLCDKKELGVEPDGGKAKQIPNRSGELLEDESLSTCNEVKTCTVR